MNFHSGREDAKMHASTRSCFYCGKVFGNHGALGSHLRIHQDNRTFRALNFPGRSRSIDINGNPPVSLPNCQWNSAGVSSQTPITSAPHPIDFSTMWRSNDANHNSLTLRTFAPSGANTAMLSAAFPLSGSAVTTGLPTVPSLYLGSNGVCEFNTDAFQISQNGLPPTSGDALKKNQGYNLDPPFSSAGRFGQFERSLSICEGSKSPYLDNNLVNCGMMNASKNPQIKELPLLKILEDSLSSSETCVSTEDEGPADLDLSLHL